MDVVHFAETHGHDQDRPRPNAWPYRDYLIRSFNEDKPYARFVEEQLAGDVLFPDDPQAIVALGFIAAGPWDESSQRDIRDDTVDKKVARNLDRDDMVATTMSTFASTTVHCARCHDHKFDPISQAEYYGLQAVFAGVDRADRPYDLDPKAESLRAAACSPKRTDLRIAAERARRSQARPGDSRGDRRGTGRLGVGRGRVDRLGDARSVDVHVGRGRDADEAGRTARSGSAGRRPEADTYTIVARTGLKGITAVRLEVLTDDGLPQQRARAAGQRQPPPDRVPGQGRAAFRTRQPPGRSLLRNPAADFDQEGWDDRQGDRRQPGDGLGHPPRRSASRTRRSSRRPNRSGPTAGRS